MSLVALHHWFRDHATMILTASASHSLSLRWDVGAVALSVVVVLGMHIWIGAQTGFLPCRLECGETYETFIQARNLSRFGWRSAGGLQDLAANPEPAEHPMLYTHNPNLTGLPFFVLLFALGIQDLHAQTPWLTLPFLVGLGYLYFAVKAATDDAALAGLCLLSAGSLYLLVALWGFHTGRVWSFLLTWGMTYHLVRAFEHGQ